MTSPVTRAAKGSALTFSELDAGLAPAINAVYVKAHFGAVGDGVTDDTAAINAAIAAVADLRGKVLVFEPGTYLVPNGITESKRGLSVLGLGVCTQGPGAQGSAVGVVIKSTGSGVWTWRKQANGDSLNTNDYYGGLFRNIAFHGNAVTAGGLKIEASYVTVEFCETQGHHTGIGTLVTTPSSGDSTQLVKLLYCGSSNDLVGFQIDGACNTLMDGCYNLKYSEGGSGIQGTGYGVICHDNNSSIRGGKFESNDIGIWVDGTPGIQINGTLFEDNATRDIKCYRASGTNGTRNLLVVNTSSVHFGPYQVNDMLVGGGWDTGKLLNEGTNCKVLNADNWP